PTSRAGLQDISDVKIDSSYAWQRMRESEFGDEYIFAKVPAPQTGELVVRVSFRATRRGIAFQNIGRETPSKTELERALRADRMVTLSPRVRKLADEITAGQTTTTDPAEPIPHTVRPTMKSAKTIPDRGND